MRNYYKNIEVARKFNVSPDTVSNWIHKALQQKNYLELHKTKTRHHLLKTESNESKLRLLSSRSKKFKNTKYIKKISPKASFYKSYSLSQVKELISTLESEREIDLKLTYFNNGIDYWDDLFYRSLQGSEFSIPRNALEILNTSLDFIGNLISSYEKVNIIDLGVGNGESIRPLITYIKNNSALASYIAIDYSKEMISLESANLNKWFRDSIKTQFFVRDFTAESIKDLLFCDSKIVKLICFIGSTLENQRNPRLVLKLLQDVMGKDDILMLGQTLKNSKSISQLTFNHKTMVPQNHKEAFFFILDDLGIPQEYYTVERFYDRKKSTRLVKIKMNYDLELRFKYENLDRTVFIGRNEKITIFRHQHHTYLQIISDLAKEGFKILYSAISKDESNIVTISRVSKLN